MSNPLVTIFCPSFNHEKYVGEMLESLISQTYKNIEIIIIDDFSTDSTSSIIKKYAYGYPEIIRFIEGEKNEGLGKRWNQMIDIQKGEYLACIGSDDILPKDAIEKRVNYLMENPQTDLLLTEFDVIDKEGAFYTGTDILQVVPQFKRFFEIKDTYDLYTMLLDGNFLHIGASLINLNSYDKKDKYLKENLPNLQDYEQLLRLVRNHKVGLLKESTYIYRWHGINHSSDENPEKNPKVIGRELLEILTDQLMVTQTVHQRIRILTTMNSTGLSIEYITNESIFNSFYDSIITCIKKNQFILAGNLLKQVKQLCQQNMDYLKVIAFFEHYIGNLVDAKFTFSKILQNNSNNKIAKANLDLIDFEINEKIISANINKELAFGRFDFPNNNEIIEGTKTFYGWILSKFGDVELQIMIDNFFIPSIQRGYRKDVLENWVQYESNNKLPGFGFDFDSSQLNNGIHKIKCFAKTMDRWVLIDEVNFLIKVNVLETLIK